MNLLSASASVRYEDFFGSQKKTDPKKKSKRDDKSDDSDSNDEEMDVLDHDNQVDNW